MNLVNLGGYMFLTALYVGAFIYSRDKSLTLPFVALVVCSFVGISPVYSILDVHAPWAIYFFYTIIYAYTATLVTDYKIRVLCIIMSIMDFILCWAYAHGASSTGIEIYLYDNFECIVTLLHIAICGSVVHGGDARSNCGGLRNWVRVFVGNLRLALLNRGQKRYNKEKSDHQAD